MKMIIPKRGQYLLLSDWFVDLEKLYVINFDKDDWDFRVKRWIEQGCKKFNRCGIVVPKGSVFTLDSIKITKFINNIKIAFYRKYNKNNMLDNHLTFTSDNWENPNTLFLDEVKIESFLKNQTKFLSCFWSSYN